MSKSNEVDKPCQKYKYDWVAGELRLCRTGAQGCKGCKLDFLCPEITNGVKTYATYSETKN